MKRVVCLAALGLMLAVPTATAQDAQPIRGGGGFNDAPRLAPGSYTDSIRIGETLHYGVPLAEGEQLTARATLSLDTRGTFEAFVLNSQIYSSLRNETYGPELPAADQEQRNQTGPMTVELRSYPASGGSESPNLHYFTLQFEQTQFQARPPKRQFDLALDIEVSGAGASGSGAPPVVVKDGPAPRDQREALEPRPSAPADGEEPAPGASGVGGVDLLVLALAGIGGLVGGLILGASATMALGRRSRAA